jgi:hypothetical protein
MLYQKIIEKMSDEDQYYNLDELKHARKLSYGQRMEMLERINEFLMKAMPEKASG